MNKAKSQAAYILFYIRREPDAEEDIEERARRTFKSLTMGDPDGESEMPEMESDSDE